MRLVALILAVPALSACVFAGAQEAADTLARDQARNVVNAEVERRFPGVDASPVTDCVIDNASAQEILTVAQAAVVGVNDRTTTTITQVLQRPETIRCVTENALLGGAVFG